jgi:hypothetical protein
MKYIEIRKKYKEKVSFKNRKIKLPFSGDNEIKKQWYNIYKDFLLLETIEEGILNKINNKSVEQEQKFFEVKTKELEEQLKIPVESSSMSIAAIAEEEIDYQQYAQMLKRNKIEQQEKKQQLVKIAKYLKTNKNERGIHPSILRNKTKFIKVKKIEDSSVIYRLRIPNKNYKSSDSRYARLCIKRKNKIKRKNHFGSIRAKFKTTKIQSYIAQFINVGSEETTYANIVKTNQLKIINLVFALKNNRKIPPKYKKVRRYTLKLAKTNIMRFAPLNIPEFVPWSFRILQQSNGEY